MGNHLKYVKLPMVDPKACETSLQNYKLGSQFKLHESFLCAGGGKGGDTCIGDGGSPLFCLLDGENVGVDDVQYVQVGVTAWGIGCSVEGVPGIYSSVKSALSWINRLVGQEFGRVAFKYYAP